MLPTVLRGLANAHLGLVERVLYLSVWKSQCMIQLSAPPLHIMSQPAQALLVLGYLLLTARQGIFMCLNRVNKYLCLKCNDLDFN